MFTLSKPTLTLDLGTNCGFVRSEGTYAGTWNLITKDEAAEQRKTGKERTGDIRFTRLYEHISDHALSVQRIVFEDVNFASTQMQAQLWASLRAAIWAVAALNPQIEVQCVPVSTLKLFATGNGGSDKDAMKAALQTKFPDLDLQGFDDNAIDAFWLMIYAEAVDAGRESWGSIWGRKQAKKKEKQAKAKAKRAKAKEKKRA